MKSLIIAFLFISFLDKSASAQNHNVLIKHTAQILIDATIKQDYSTVVDYTYPKLVEASGGKDSLLNMIKGTFKKMKDQGVDLIIVSASIDEPGNETRIGSTLYCVVPEKLVLKINGKSYRTASSLIGISSDNGDHWSFADASGLEQLKAIQPDVNKLDIPANTAPTLIKDN